MAIAPWMDVHLSAADLRAAMERDVRTGLSAAQKWLPPIYFYDERGSELFDEITRLPEYYLTRAERAVLEAHAADIADAAGADTLVELGAGTCDKTRVLLDAMDASGRLQRYVPLDVSDGTLWAAATALADEYPGVAVHAVVGDFHRHMELLPKEGRRLVAFLGSTIGNLTPAERRRFLFDLDCALDHDDRLLLGTDLLKDAARLVPAYDDSQGVTAAFNRNVLHVVNRELHADFDPERFSHVARWNVEDHWMEMRLRSVCEQVVTVADLSLEVRFAEGEDLLTEISAKFTLPGVEEELHQAGFVVDAMWQDPARDFLLTLARPYC
jgi:L-histidine Nalpha-methyltransferase